MKTFSITQRTLTAAIAVMVFASLLLFPQGGAAQSSETALRPNDKVVISIGGVPPDEVQQISKTYAISDSGKINLLHIGEIAAAGLKPSVLQTRIEDAYKAAQIYTHPTVTVSMDSTVDTARYVYVVSGCEKNGPVPYRTGLTLLQAVGSAGGSSPFGKTTRTQVIRNKSTTVHDLKKITKNPSLDPQLLPDDQIIIPE